MMGDLESAKPFKTIKGADDQSFKLLPPEALPEGVEGPSAFLGKGAFGTVSIAFSNDAVLAVKSLRLDKTSPKYHALIAEISKEISIMRHLGRNADLIIEESTDPNQANVFVVQPFISGMEVDDYFKNLNTAATTLAPDDVVGKLQLLKEAMTCWIACLRAAKQLHEKNVLHGDLHNGNILYDPNTNQATIIDFGMSHQLKPGKQAIFLTEESLIHNYHRAPETKELAVRRKGHPPERCYDKSSDVYSLAIDFGVSSEFTEYYAPDFAGKEVAQIMKVFKEMSQEKMIGGNGKAEQRASLEEAITRLVAIQAQIDIRILQKKVFNIPLQEIKTIAEKFDETNSLVRQFRENGLPPNIKEEIKALAKQIKGRRLEIKNQNETDPKKSLQNTLRPAVISHLNTLGKRPSNNSVAEQGSSKDPKSRKFPSKL